MGQGQLWGKCTSYSGIITLRNKVSVQRNFPPLVSCNHSPYALVSVSMCIFCTSPLAPKSAMHCSCDYIEKKEPNNSGS